MDSSSSATPTPKRLRACEDRCAPTAMLDKEKWFSKEELEVMIREALLEVKGGEYCADVIGVSVFKPSEVWDWAERLVSKATSMKDKDANVALGWKNSCTRLLAERAKEAARAKAEQAKEAARAKAEQAKEAARAKREAAEEERRENSPPSDEPDAKWLAERWIRIGQIDIPEAPIPDNLAEKLLRLAYRYREFDQNEESAEPERISEAVVQILCECMGVSYFYGIRGKASKFPSDVAFPNATRFDSSEDLSVEKKGGVIELKGFVKGMTHHGAALIQASKYMHARGKDKGNVGTVWANIVDGVIFINYRVGKLDWNAKRVVACATKLVVFIKECVEPQKWRELCGFISWMEGITGYHTVGDPELTEEEECLA